MNSGYPLPSCITDLPEADIPLEGVRSYLVQGVNQQMIFMAFDRDVDVPSHSHEAQWAVVLAGEIELTIGDHTRIYKQGDTYFIPKNVMHGARIKKGYSDLTYFNQKDRYGVK